MYFIIGVMTKISKKIFNILIEKEPNRRKGEISSKTGRDYNKYQSQKKNNRKSSREIRRFARYKIS